MESPLQLKTMYVYNIHGLSKGQQIWLSVVFRPKNVGLQYILLLLRFFTFFLKIEKTWLFTFFCLASHVFLNYGRSWMLRKKIGHFLGSSIRPNLVLIRPWPWWRYKWHCLHGKGAGWCRLACLHSNHAGLPARSLFLSVMNAVLLKWLITLMRAQLQRPCFTVGDVSHIWASITYLFDRWLSVSFIALCCRKLFVGGLSWDTTQGNCRCYFILCLFRRWLNFEVWAA